MKTTRKTVAQKREEERERKKAFVLSRLTAEEKELLGL